MWKECSHRFLLRLLASTIGTLIVFSAQAKPGAGWDGAADSAGAADRVRIAQQVCPVCGRVHGPQKKQEQQRRLEQRRREQQRIQRQRREQQRIERQRLEQKQQEQEWLEQQPPEQQRLPQRQRGQERLQQPEQERFEQEQRGQRRLEQPQRGQQPRKQQGAQDERPRVIKVGSVAKIVGDVHYVWPSSGKRIKLRAGVPVHHLGRFITGPGARLQVALEDNTVFTAGPNTDMYIDEFVYDPFDDTGKIVARVTKGVLRWVTGKVARKDAEKVTIKGPVGDLGFRGTDVEFRIVDDFSTRVKVHSGAVQFTPIDRFPDHKDVASSVPVIIREGVDVDFRVHFFGVGITVYAGEVTFAPRDSAASYVIRAGEWKHFNHSGQPWDPRSDSRR